MQTNSIILVCHFFEDEVPIVENNAAEMGCQVLKKTLFTNDPIVVYELEMLLNNHRDLFTFGALAATELNKKL